MLIFDRYRAARDGNVAMMFAFLAFVLALASGAAIDYSNIVRVQNQLQAQVDAAVLAAATADLKALDNDDQQSDGDSREKRLRKEEAIRVIKANGFDMSSDPKLTLKKHSVILEAEVKYTPFFGGLVGKEEMSLSAVSESGLRKQTGVEIVLVLDNTNSMSVNGKMDALKEGAENLIDAIEESGSESKIGIVPFARYVRVNESARTASWFDMPVEFETTYEYQQATHTGGTCTTTTETHTSDGVEQTFEMQSCTGQTTTYETKEATVESRWDGCVGTRVPPFSEQDGAYSHKIPGLLDRVPYQHTGLTWNVDTWCPSEILPMTDDYRKLRSKINGLWPTDDTYIPTGLIWGQRVLSPGEPYDNVQDGSPKRQIMVLMTDGENTTEIMQDTGSVGNMKSPPYIGSVNGTPKVAPAANAATNRLCASVKASGIEIYTIAFQVKDPATKTMLRNCASHPSKALTAGTNQSLVKQFEKVAKSLEAEVRLMR